MPNDTPLMKPTMPRAPSQLAPLWDWLGCQLHHPQGIGGAWIGRAMALANAQPNHLAIQALGLRPGDQVLELGFGPGLALRHMQQRWDAHFVGVDPSHAMLRQAENRNRRALAAGRMRLHQSDLGTLERLGYGPASFDRILGVNVAYFFSPGGTEFPALHRLLKPGGRLVLFVTDRETMQHWRFAQGAHHHLWSASALRQALELAGFASGDVHINHCNLPLGIKGLLAVAELPVADDVAPLNLKRRYRD